jgi:hypothetical protein
LNKYVFFDKLQLLFLLLFFSFSFHQKLNGQIEMKFVQYLSQSGLKQEHLQYINEVNSTPDSIAFLKAKYYLQYQQDSLFLATFPMCISLFVEDTNAYNYTNWYFLKDFSSNRDKWFSYIDTYHLPDNLFSNYYALTNNPLDSANIQIPADLKDDFLSYKKAFRKSPWLAATLSTVIPGLGELYIGNFQTSLTKLMSLSVFGLQSAESIALFGLLHPLPVINVGLFSLFYGANIIGSYLDTKRKKRNLKNQFLLHVSKHFNDYSLSSIY